MLATAAMVGGLWLYAAAQEDSAADADAAAEQAGALRQSGAASGASVQVLGDADQKLHLVDHGGTWSMHAENIATPTLLNLWRRAGGPEVVSKAAVDRPFTLSVHRLEPERILERILEGYSYTLHYEPGGSLSQVRVYSPDPSLAFRVPRLVESLGTWREVETAASDPNAAARP